MSPAHVLEPTYQSLKRGLMQGNWRPGERLEALRLAEEFGVSMTPVRDCLNRLVGEALVEMKLGDGYHVPRVSEKPLRDMLDLNAMLLDFALLHSVSRLQTSTDESTVQDYAGRVAALFNAIAVKSGNIVLAETLQSLSDRMHVIRRWEPQLFPDCFQELEGLGRSLAGDTQDLRAGLRKFHDRRRSTIAELVQLAQS